MSVLTRILPERSKLRTLGRKIATYGEIGNELVSLAKPLLSGETSSGLQAVASGVQDLGINTQKLSAYLPMSESEKLQIGLAKETLQRFAEKEAIDRESRFGRVRSGRIKRKRK